METVTEAIAKDVSEATQNLTDAHLDIIGSQNHPRAGSPLEEVSLYFADRHELCANLVCMFWLLVAGTYSQHLCKGRVVSIQATVHDAALHCICSAVLMSSTTYFVMHASIFIV